MNFADKMQKNAGKMQNVYDLVAFCYDFLVDTTGNQANFLGTYIFEDEDASKTNPNMNMLLKMSESAVDILREIWQGIEFSQCLFKLQILLRQTEKNLVKYQEIIKNDATIPFWLMKAVDRYIGEMNDNDRGTRADEPLNCGVHRKSYVYVRRSRMMIEDAAEELEFSNSISRACLREQLEHLIILEKKQLEKGMAVPQIVELLIDEEDDNRVKIVKGKHLKLAVIPFAKMQMVKFPSVHGGSFRVIYKDGDRTELIYRAVFLLEQAIDAGANIIVYPEFVCDKQIQEAIGRKLASLYETSRERVKDLLIVLAGSRWDTSDNNVAVWYSYKGRKLGEYYKYCSYYDPKTEKVEYLTARGKKNTIISVNGMGLLQAGICRDVSDNTYMQSLTNVFVPAFLLVPAWSTSVNIGFYNQLKNITSQNRRTSCVLCNCCEATRNSEKANQEVGMFVSPLKDGSIVKGRTRKIARTKECKCNCSTEGCFFMLDIDFSTKAVEKGCICRNVSQKICCIA